ncbi:19217_t:CDS:2 [Cetraspora pellucida]|uniref:19217_t:CDS:1 n=1 Tax=Cetraspora pellucida TaxID=1433469 RepID=A0A9N8Z8F8_9GLOM|nr:19217_t:CDS:2 [Cetraspora pellucida]
MTKNIKELIGTLNGQDSFHGCGTFRKDYLNQHIKINSHINVIKAYYQPANQIDLFTGFTTQADYNKLEIISKMQCVYLCTQKYLPIFAYPNIINLMNLNLKNQTELVYNSEIQTLTPPFFGPKKEKLVMNFSENSSNYVEYTNLVSGTTFLHAIAIVIEESVLEETRKSSAWSLLINESNTITYNKTCIIVSKHVANNIPVLQYLGLIELKEVDAIAKILEPSKLLHFGSDGDSKMIGVRNGIATKLKKLNPFISNCYCIAHRLALAEKDSANDVPYFLDYEITIKELYVYFANSHTTKFLADILSIISALCKIFQSNYVTFSNIHQELNKTIYSITIEFIVYPDENIKPTLGTHLHDYLLYNAICIFDFKQVPTTIQQMSSFGEEEIVYLAEYYSIDQIENGWVFIFCTTQFITQYPNLIQIIHLVFIVPVSNRNVEHIFSQQNLIKTKLHNLMKLNTLNSYLMIVMNGPSLDKFNFKKAYEL